MRLSFVVPGIPCAKKRHRTVPLQQCLQCQKTIQGQYRDCPECHGALRFIKNLSYSDSESVKYENLVAYCAREAMLKAGMEKMFDKPVKMDMLFTFPIPVSRQCSKHVGDPHTQSPRLDSLVKNMQDIMGVPPICKKLHPTDPHAQRPDLDNLSKSLDGLIGVLFADDAIISQLTAKKVWGSCGSAEITVEEI